MRRCEAPIDNKNLCEDPFEDEVFCDGFYEAHDHRKGNKRHLIGMKEVKGDEGFIDASGIVDVAWSWGDSSITITLLAISGVANTYDWEDARKYIFDDYRKVFKAWECDSNPDLRVQFAQVENELTVSFYFECED